MTDRINALACLLTLVVGVTLSGLVGAPAPERVAVTAGPDLGAAPEIVTMKDGRPGLVDETGAVVAIADYRRIVAAGTVASQVALAVLEPDRVVAWSRFAIKNSLEPWRYAGKPTVASERDLEQVLALKPDLVLFNRVGSLGTGIARMRARGIQVFDLGTMLGVDTMIGDLRTVATLVGVPERGDRVAARYLDRLRRVAADVPADQRPRALYLGLHGGEMFGGTRGSSFHDMLVYAGLRDVAEDDYEGWPSYNAEQLLKLDPDLIVTQTESMTRVCTREGLEMLRACRGVDGARLVGVPAAVLVDPGFGVLEAAEAIHAAVFDK